MRLFRRWILVGPVLSILSLSLLVWTYSAVNSDKRQTQVVMAQSPPEVSETSISKKVPPVKLKTLVVSAYLEHRLWTRQVRVIAVVLRNEPAPYQCHLRCPGAPDAITTGKLSIHWDHFAFPYGTSDIMCSLPPNCQSPSHVSLTSTTHKELCDQTILEVKNQEQKLDSFKYNFTVCWSTMFDFKNVLQVVQSLEMLQILGVNKVIIYKTSCTADVQRVLDYYSQKGLVELIPWTMSQFLNVSRGWQINKDPGDLHYYGQLAALNDCIYRYMYQSKYMAMHDVDELILPQKVSSLPEMLPHLISKYKYKECFAFLANVFPNTVTWTTANSTEATCWQNVSGVNILAHLHQEPFIPDNPDFKIIVNPRYVKIATVHGLLEPWDTCSKVDLSEARMYHTREPKQPKLTRDELIYDGRLLSYSERMKEAVTAVLRENRLLSKNVGSC